MGQGRRDRLDVKEGMAERPRNNSEQGELKTTIRKAPPSARKPAKTLTSRESPPGGVTGPFTNYSHCM